MRVRVRVRARVRVLGLEVHEHRAGGGGGMVQVAEEHLGVGEAQVVHHAEHRAHLVRVRVGYP